MRDTLRLVIFCVLACLAFGQIADAEEPAMQLTIDAKSDGKAISPDLMGVFYEDLSHAADGGLYAELVRNRSFEFSQAERDDWNGLTGWELIERDGGEGKLILSTGAPIHPNNPHYLTLGVRKDQGSTGIRNSGYDGIALKAGERYRFSVFARQLADRAGPLRVQLESKDGKVLCAADLPTLNTKWTKYETILTPDETDTDARLILLATRPGRIGIDMVSLFPVKTFHDRPNGLRADLAQAVADLKPRFVRFPGGCLVHGDGLDNMYRWKNTVGPVEQRKADRNIWGYHQSVGLGFFEYFQFCEDIGAKPLPVLPAGVSCQNSGAGITGRWGRGQCAIAIEDMPAYIQDVLDLIEYANGPADSTWGSVRAAAGHPEPFGLKYVGIGNEDHITPEFEQRFKMIFDALKQKHPEITVIGTTGPGLRGEDYDKGWAFAEKLEVPVLDEHGYLPPDWWWDHLSFYDTYLRNKAKVYLGEWAAHERNRANTLRSAIAEAAFLTSLERNGDVVIMSSYAPLFAKLGHVNWRPDLIYFNNTDVFLSINYYVQQLFSLNAGDRYLDEQLQGLPEGERFAVSAVRDSATGDVIIKLVNGQSEAKTLSIKLEGATNLAGKAMTTVLAGEDPDAVNEGDTTIRPISGEIAVGQAFDYQAPANSLTVIRIPRQTR